MEPTFSGNPLKDVHDNVKAGIIVTLRTKDKYFCLHECSRQYIVDNLSSSCLRNNF